MSSHPHSIFICAPINAVSALEALCAARGLAVDLQSKYSDDGSEPATHKAVVTGIGPGLAGELLALDAANKAGLTPDQIATQTGITVEGYTPDEIAAVLTAVTIKIEQDAGLTPGREAAFFAEQIAALGLQIVEGPAP